MSLAELISIARGDAPADLVLKNARIAPPMNYGPFTIRNAVANSRQYIRLIGIRHNVRIIGIVRGLSR